MRVTSIDGATLFGSRNDARRACYFVRNRRTRSANWVASSRMRGKSVLGERGSTRRYRRPGSRRLISRSFGGGQINTAGGHQANLGKRSVKGFQVGGATQVGGKDLHDVGA